MARSPQSSLLIAHTITWAGAVLCALIATYGRHDPTTHPKILVICLLPMAGVSLGSLHSKAGSRKVIVSHLILWIIACLTPMLLVNTSLGEGVNPIASTVVLLVLGAASLGILSGASFETPSVESETPDE